MMGGLYWLASYPKSGNTWFRTVLANLNSEGETPVDINALATGSIASSRNWIDDVIGVDTADLTQDEVEALRPSVYRWSVDEAPGVVGYHKIHDAFGRRADGRPLVDERATLGAVYLLRNPLDVAPSLANHNAVDLDEAIAQMGNPDHSLARSTDRLSGQLLQRLGTWSQHVEGWGDAPEITVHVMRYEDMQADPEASFGAAFAFLGLEASPSRLRAAIEASRFEKLATQEEERGFRERPPKAARFFRKGQVGDWRHALSEAQVHRIIADHGPVMRRFGYLDAQGKPI